MKDYYSGLPQGTQSVTTVIRTQCDMADQDHWDEVNERIDLFTKKRIPLSAGLAKSGSVILLREELSIKKVESNDVDTYIIM